MYRLCGMVKRETATVMRASHFLFLFAFSYSLEHFRRSHRSCFMCYRLCLAQGGWFGLYPLGRKDVLFLICTVVWSGLAGSLIPVLAGRPDAEQRNIWKYKIHLFGKNTAFFLVFCDEVQSKSSWLWKPVWKSLTWQDALQCDWSIAGKFVLLLAVKLLSEFSWWAAVVLLSVAVEESFGLGNRSCHRITAFSRLHVPCGRFAPFLLMQWGSLVSEKAVCLPASG